MTILLTCATQHRTYIQHTMIGRCCQFNNVLNIVSVYRHLMYSIEHQTPCVCDKVGLDVIVRFSITGQSFFDQPNLLNYRYSSVNYVGAGLSYTLHRYVELMQTIVHTSLF